MQNPQMIASRIKQLAKDNNISIGNYAKNAVWVSITSIKCPIRHPFLVKK